MKLAAGPQIAPLYGTAFRSTPVFFFKTIMTTGKTIPPLTYPVPWFQLQLARSTQQLYYPEFLPDINRSAGLPYSTTSARRAFRKLWHTAIRPAIEILLYDVRRTLNVGELNAVFLDSNVENWLTDRTAFSRHPPFSSRSIKPAWMDCRQMGEWYPDVLHPETGSLTTQIPKPY